CLQTKNAPRTF
nr:immunoglobulin light chain junction region [Macaca mulatta]MOY12653.1 immunoglobulin light chain junction region [Macaca mulatta]MOY13169.1 immunoglobulin light chain junction region [Macaca mulatta]MOY13807.1 immunoglobulin light chain junction region [Macaca mulatta]